MSLTEVRVLALERRAEAAARKLRQLTDELRAVEQHLRAVDALSSGGSGTSSGSGTAGIYFVAPVGGIPARSGTTVGSATCNVWSRSGTTIASAATTATIYNVSSTAVGASKYGWAAWDGSGYIVVVESCA